MELKDSLTKIRKAKGYSQVQIAELLQTTQQQYSKYEIGKQEMPIHHVITLCEFYKVTANELIGIDTFMTEGEAENKFNKLFDKVIEIINWAEYQEHISEDAASILIENINESKQDIEAK